MNKGTVELLEKHFDIAFAAPDGIKKMRELILTLAMQGKLVEQDPQDQPASELLKEIEAEKRRLVKEGKIKTPKPLPEIKPEEVTYQLPDGWEWVRLGEIGFWKSGTTPSRTNSAYYGGTIPWVKSGEVKQGRISSTEEMITEKALSECSLNINPVGAVLIAMYGANIGEVGILEIEATTNQAVCACTTYSLIDKTFLLNLLISIKPNFVGQGAGAAQPNISREKIINTIIPLPPLAEQQRIVARIDQLMARCDELENLRAERVQKRLAVHTAALNRLLVAQERDSFADAWQFITRHFGQLYSVKENVAELRKTILQLAVMGKLVPQDPNDPPASALLKEIETEKRRLVKEGKIKKANPLQEIKAEEMPYQLPDGWEWCYLQDVFALVTDGDHQAPPKSEAGIPFLVIGNLNKGSVSMDRCRFVPDTYYDSLDWGRKPTNSDLLYTVTGSYGIPIRVDADQAFCVQRHVAILKSSKSSPVDYIARLLSSKVAFQYATSIATGIAQKTVPLTGLRKMPIVLPPLPEQQRIVAKIDHLMALCDQLEQQIDAATTKQSALLNAVMAQL